MLNVVLISRKVQYRSRCQGLLSRARAQGQKSSDREAGDGLVVAVLGFGRGEPAERRRSLDLVRAHLADRDTGAKVSEVAQLLGLSQPTVRAWMAAGVLQPRGMAAPARVDVLSLAEVKRAADLLREHGEDRNFLVAVLHLLRDRGVLAGGGIRGGFEDLSAGRVVPVPDGLLEELSNPAGRKKRSTST